MVSGRIQLSTAEQLNHQKSFANDEMDFYHLQKRRQQWRGKLPIPWAHLECSPLSMHLTRGVLSAVKHRVRPSS